MATLGVKGLQESLANAR